MSSKIKNIKLIVKLIILLSFIFIFVNITQAIFAFSILSNKEKSFCDATLNEDFEDKKL